MGISLVVNEADFLRIRTHLVRKDGIERAVSALIGKSKGPKGNRYTLYDVRPIEDGEYSHHSSGSFSIKP